MGRWHVQDLLGLNWYRPVNSEGSSRWFDSSSKEYVYENNSYVWVGEGRIKDGFVYWSPDEFELFDREAYESPDSGDRRYGYVFNRKYYNKIVEDFYDQIDVAANSGGDWVSDIWNWTKDHFYIGAEGEITYGVQLSGIVYKGVGLNLAPVSQVVAEGKISNRDSYLNSYSIKPFAYMDKGKALDFGASYYGGVNYNWNIVNGKYVSSTVSVGIFGFGGNIIWDKTGVTNLFVGFELSGKVAAGWGAGGSGKIGFTWD